MQLCTDNFVLFFSDRYESIFCLYIKKKEKQPFVPGTAFGFFFYVKNKYRILLSTTVTVISKVGDTVSLMVAL